MITPALDRLKNRMQTTLPTPSTVAVHSDGVYFTGRSWLFIMPFKKGDIWNLTHGLSKTPTYRKWLHMKMRCKAKGGKCFVNYVLRGIQVCDQWQTFEGFFKDMGESPTIEHQIDRIDNDKGYYPENCRWVTRYENQLNKRNTRWVTYNGETKIAKEWARILGMGYDTLLHRLNVGWSVEQAFTMRPRFGNRKIV